MELTQQAKEIDNIRLPTGWKLKELLELTPSEKKYLNQYLILYLKGLKQILMHLKIY